MGLNAANPYKVEFQNFMHRHNNNNNNNNTMFRSLGNSSVTRPLNCITSGTSLSPPHNPPPPISHVVAGSEFTNGLFILQTEDVKSQIMEVIKAVILQRETARSHLNYTVIAPSYFLTPFC